MEEQNQPPKLTKKQEIFVDTYAKTGDATKSAFKSFDVSSLGSAAALANEYLKKPQIIQAVEIKRKTLKQALIDKGIDEDKIAEKVGVLLEATDKEGNDDYVAIDKGLKHATVLHGVVDPEDKRDSPRTTYNFIFSDKTQVKIREMEDEIKGLLIKKPDVEQN